MRVQLNGDCGPDTGSYSLPVALDDDYSDECRCGGACCGDDDDESPGEPLPVLTVRERKRSSVDFTGTPLLAWHTAAHGASISYVERRETNDATGQTKVTATAVLGWDEDEYGAAPKESAVVWDDAGNRWELTSCTALPGRLNLVMERIDDAP